jgi:hypothetical protein
VLGVVAGEQAELIALGGRRASLDSRGGGLRDDLAPKRGVTRQQPEVAQHVKPGRRYRRNEAGEHVAGLEDERAGAVAPDALER